MGISFQFSLEDSLEWNAGWYGKFLLAVCMVYLSQPFYFQLICVFESKVSLLEIESSRSCLYTQSDNICLLIGVFRPFTFNIIINMFGFIVVILLSVFSMLPVFLFVLIHCLLLCEINVFLSYSLNYYFVDFKMTFKVFFS